MKKLFLLLLLISSGTVFGQVTLKKGMSITKSITVAKRVYKINDDLDLKKGVVEITGNNIVVDFKNAILVGSNNKKNPDEFYGLGIRITGKNVTIKNLTAQGFKVALMALHADGLIIENCNFSYNYRQRLNSTQEKEDISDWMSYHQNENDEWLRYGAAMYLRNSNNVTIKGTKVTGGQNALMMMECNNGLIFNNDFSFNSGIGLGMYKCSFNKVLYNKINFNVRGYSHGVYNRGQDSAGILVYEQSNNNLFYKNSVTHGGDGFFLWAGQITMNTGEGGCNDNVLMDNDFSYAPTNGIEATFSRNKFIHNRVFECDHGIWGGYSFDTEISGNQFRNNRIAIAIEHGLHNRIHHNLFFQDKEAIRLWARKEQPADWAYAKLRDTRSAGYMLVGNSFNKHNLVYNFTRTDSLKIFENRVALSEQEFKIDSTVTNVDSSYDEELLYKLSEDYIPDLPAIKNPADPFKGGGRLSGRKNIMITEWGPYNFSYPYIRNVNPIDTGATMQFELFGPKGNWKIISVKGVKNVSARSGKIPATITAEKTGNLATDIEIIAQFTGEAFRDEFGNRVAAKKPYRFSFKKFFQPINFTVSWYSLDSTNNPLEANLSQMMEKQAPFKTELTQKLDYAWWGGIKAGDKQYGKFLTMAEGQADFPPGLYEMSVTWDDAVRVYLDGKLLVNEWDPSKFSFDGSPNKKVSLSLNGTHMFKIEHAELGGFATLSLKFKKLK